VAVLSGPGFAGEMDRPARHDWPHPTARFGREWPGRARVAGAGGAHGDDMTASDSDDDSDDSEYTQAGD
jgi:hypothetical protein